MKRFKITFLLLLITIFVYTQGKYYYSFNEKIYLDVVENKIVISFNKNNFSNIENYLKQKVNIQEIEFHQENTSCIITTDVTNANTLIKDLSMQAGIKTVKPMYLACGGYEFGITDKIIMKFLPHITQQEIDNINTKYNVEVIYLDDVYQYISVPAGADALDVANAYQESGLVDYSHPDFIAKIERSSYFPEDPYFQYQYYLRDTGQVFNGLAGVVGADINVLKAWNITLGSSDIIIAITDDGVTSNHPDLPNSRQIRLQGSNYITDSENTNQNNPSPSGNHNHGNACAGIIAASHNNEGIAGSP